MSTRTNIACLSVMTALLQGTPLLAQTTEPIQSAEIGSGGIMFMENKGQMIDQDGRRNDRILYLLNTGAYNVQLRVDGFSYDFRSMSSKPGKVENGIPLSYWNYHRIDMTFEDVSPDMQIIAQDTLAGVTHHYCATCGPTGIHDVYSYRSVLYKNVKPGIDIQFRGNVDSRPGFEYDLIVQPWAEVSDLWIRVNGAPFRVTENGELAVRTRFGEMIERIPASWYTSGTGRTEAEVRYIQKDRDHVAFKVQATALADLHELTVDPTPTLTWGTYFGAENNEEVTGLAHYSSGVYMCGRTKSESVFGTTGAHQVTNASLQQWDGFLSKFNSTGALLWSTFYGGTSIDYISDVAVDPNNGDVVVAGAGLSTSGIATAGSHQSSNGGQADAFLAKFNSSGVRQWGTYYGGSLVDRAFGVRIDGSGNIYMAGDAQSSTNIATASAYQTTFGGQTDAFLVKFNSSGSRQWGTYLGGSNHDSEGIVALDGTTSVYFSGNTQSSSGIATTGAHQTTLGGGLDVFVGKFTPSGSLSWCTYYGGTAADRNGWHMSSNCAGGITISGTTGSTTGIASSSAWQTILGGGTDAFLAKFNSLGVRTWGTYFGGTGSDDIDAIEVWTDDVIYCAGSTSSSGMATTGAQQTSYGGNTDGFLATFSGSGNRTWCSYYGGSSQDRIVSAALRAGSFYVGGSSSGGGMSTTGAFQVSPGSYDDAVLSRWTGPAPWACPSEKSMEITPDEQTGTWTCFPNPTTAILTIASSDLHPGGTLEVFSPLGSVVWSGQVQEEAFVNIDLSALPAGVYWVKYEFRDLLRTTCIQKQ